MDTKEIEDKVLIALEEIRPFLQRDGGDVSLVSIDNDINVKVRLEGTCAGCSINAITLKMGIENTIKKFVPNVKSVEDVGLEVEE
ncbi:MAG: NifU family protein [Flavobacteriales bacterium]|nr:NifU family protein [Flavobacteriales bacterium]